MRRVRGVWLCRILERSHPLTLTLSQWERGHIARFAKSCPANKKGGPIRTALSQFQSIRPQTNSPTGSAACQRLSASSRSVSYS